MKRWLIRIALTVSSLAVLFIVATASMYFSMPPSARAQTNTFCASNLACTVTGAWTFSGAAAFKNLNTRLYADQFPGATADLQIKACLAALSPTGVCDATGYAGTTQTIASTITVQQRATLLFDPATFFQPGAANTNLFIFEPNSVIRGFGFDCTNFSAWSGILFQNDTAQHYFPTDGQTEISNIRINASCQAATGTGLKLTSNSSGLGVSFLNIHDWRAALRGDLIFMTAVTGGFVSGVQMVNIQSTGNTQMWHMTGAGAGIRGNFCFGCAYELVPGGTQAVLIDGGSGAGVTGNQWMGPIYDTNTAQPINITNTVAARNQFIGAFDGTFVDVNGLNDFWDFDRTAASGLFVMNGTLRPSVPGASDLGTTAWPYGNLLLGTANGNYTQFNPLASAGGKLVTIPDWSVSGSIFQNFPFVSTLTSQYTNSTTGFTNVAGGNTIQFNVVASRNYTATCHLYYQAAATGGLNIEFTGPAAPTAIIYGLNDPSAATTFNASVATAYGTSLGQVVGTAATNFDAIVSFSLVNGANAGTVNLLAKSSAAAQLQIQSGSFCKVN